jgi:hypothetical protein
VETVFTDAVLFVVVIRNGIQISFRSHGLMELGIKHTDIGNAGHGFFAGFDTGEVRGIVQRTEGEALTDNVFNLFGDEHRSGDFFSAVQNAAAINNNKRIERENIQRRKSALGQSVNRSRSGGTA